MQLQCSRCRHVLEYTSERPSFCAFCGHALIATQLEDSGQTGSEAATLAPAPSQRTEADTEPKTVGGYRLLRPLGSGGMGSVYEGEELATGRRVAVKLIAAEYVASQSAVERFRQEGRLASQIAHPRCVFVLAADEEAGRPYIVMELMPGSTLQDLVKEKGPLPAQQAVRKILDVIEGLQEAHQLGVIHRDVKPSNCFLEPDGRVKIGDFGLAKSLASESHLTKTGSFVGTVLFASPEQVRKDPLDQQTDVYSVAATLYYLLTGRAPFQTGDAAATVARIVSDPAPPLRSLRPELSPALDEVVLHGLERNRERRWRDLEEFRKALLPFVEGHSYLVGLGIRFGAYVIDYVVLVLFGMGMMAVRGFEQFTNPQAANDPRFYALGGLVLVLYFGVLEGIWGCALGKWLLQLRVWTARGSHAPGLGRALLRAALGLLLNLGNLGTLLVLPWLQSNQAEMKPEGMLRQSYMLMLITTIPLLELALGVGLILSTMRARNGYRGLHELFSGTRVVRLPGQRKRLTVWSHRLDQDLTWPAGLPERCGSFTVRGALRWTAEVKMVLAEDVTLGRKVVLWFRPLGDPLLDTARREINRMTRLRWLACGKQGDWQWDAFLAPSGCLLPAWIAREGRLPWSMVRLFLEQLTDELVVACADGTLPSPLTVAQVSVQANGQVVLLDAPLSDSCPSPDERSVQNVAPVAEPKGGVVRAWLEARYWRDWSVWQLESPDGWVRALSSAAWWSCSLILLAYAALAVWFPTRSLHDRLAGTYLVPR